MATTYTVTNTFTDGTTAVASEVSQNFTDVLTALNAYDASNLASGTVPVARISGLTTTQIAAATLVIESEGITSNDNDTTWPTSAAVKDYTDTTIAAFGGVIKAWVNFDGDDGSINDSYNVTSVSRSALGTYVITWDTNFADANYVIVGFVADSVNSAGVVCNNGSDAPLAAGTAQITTNRVDGPAADYNLVCVMAIGTQ
jgi:hypothetical protein